MREKIYISGPLKGFDMTERKKVFNEMHNRLTNAGYAPVNPLENGLTQEATYQEHMIADIKLLLDCKYMMVLPGYEHSEGCQTEIAVARSCGIKIIFYLK